MAVSPSVEAESAEQPYFTNGGAPAGSAGAGFDAFSPSNVHETAPAQRVVVVVVRVTRCCIEESKVRLSNAVVKVSRRDSP